MDADIKVSLETLIKRYQDGEPDADAQLWNRLEPYYRRKAYDFYLRHSVTCLRAGIDTDDLIYYAGYSAMIESARNYNNTLGIPAFSYLHFALRNEYAKLCGYRKSSVDALQDAIPLDSPLSDTDDLTLLDTLEDEESTDFVTAGDMIEDAVIIRDEVAKTLSGKPKVYGAILDRYFRGLTLAESAKNAGCSTEMIRQREKQAFKILESNQVLESMYYERIGTLAQSIRDKMRYKNIAVFRL